MRMSPRLAAKQAAAPAPSPRLPKSSGPPAAPFAVPPRLSPRAAPDASRLSTPELAPPPSQRVPAPPVAPPTVAPPYEFLSGPGAERLADKLRTGAALGYCREEGFDIVVASEVMAIFCL